MQGAWYGHEWIGACMQRSRIQWLRDLCLDNGFINEAEAYLDVEEWDEFLVQRGELEGGLSLEKIPPKIPVTHWWWYYGNDT